MTFLITWSISDPPFSKKRQYLLGAVFIKVSVSIIYVFFHLVCHKTATKDIVIFTCHTTWATTCPRLTLLFRILAGLQVPHLTLPGTGIYFWKRYVASLCLNFSYVIYSRYFLKKSNVQLRRNFSLPNHHLELWRWTGSLKSSTLCPHSVWLLVLFPIKKFAMNSILRDLWLL